jgi:hypothetical protein
MGCSNIAYLDRIEEATSAQGVVVDGVVLKDGKVAYAGLPVGFAAGTVAAGDDARFNSIGVTSEHAATHARYGSDALTLEQAQITGLVAALAGKQPVGGYATAAQGAKADTALQQGTAMAMISGLVDALDGKQAAGSYATAAQGALADTALQSGTAISTVSGLSTALSAKADLVGGKVDASQLPALAITDTFIAADQAAMLALSTAEVGDVAIRTDVSKSFILKVAGPATLANWQELLTPPNAVLSVAGKVGAVDLAAADISGLGTAATTAASAYATAAQGTKADSALQSGAAISAISGLQTALDGKQASGSYESAGAASSAVSAHAAKADGSAHTISGVSGLQTALDGKQASGSYATATQGAKADAAVVANAAITGATKTKITYDSKGLITSGADATTADIADSANKRYCTDAQKTVIGNTSGTNTGDETASTIKTKLEITTLSGSNTGDQTLSGLGGVPTARTVNAKALSADITLTQDDVASGATNKAYTAAEQTKLAGIAAGATNYTHPANHAPSIITQDSSNRFVTDAQITAWTAKQAALGYTAENAANKGQASGYASLDANGLVPTTQLPSYVDDVVEAASLTALNALSTKATGKIYVALDTNKTYRWSGSAFVYITSGAVDSVAGKTGVVSLISSDVGLGNVANAAQVTAVSGTAPIVSSGGTTPAISISAATTSAAGSMSSADKTKLDAITGANTGDETASTIKTKLGISTLSGINTGDQDLSGYALKSGSLTQLATRSHGDLTSVGTNTHAQIDTHIAATGASVHGLGTAATGTTGTASGNIPTRPAAESLSADHIAEITSAHGVDVDGVLLKDSLVRTPSAFTGACGCYEDSRATALFSNNNSAGTMSALMVATQYNGAWPNYGLVLVNGANTSDFDVWGIMHDGPASAAGGLKIGYAHGSGGHANVHGVAPFVTVRKNGDVIVGTDPGGSELLRVGGDVAVAAANSVKTNHIAEVTSAHGVDVDGVLCKDGKIKLQSVANVYDTISPLMIRSIYKQHKSLTTANKNRLTVDTAAWSSTDVGAAPVAGAYVGGVLLPDGRVFCVPYVATQARIYDAAGGFTDVGAAPVAGAYQGGVLLPDGRVFCVPHYATQARIYDAAGGFTDVGAAPGGCAYVGGVLLPDGRVFCVPFNATQARIYDAAGGFTDVGAAPVAGAYQGGVLLPDGRVFCVPLNATQARIYDAAGGFTDVGAAPGGNAYIGGVLLPDGRVFCVPFNATQARIYAGAISHASLNFPTPLLLGGTLNKF